MKKKKSDSTSIEHSNKNLSIEALEGIIKNLSEMNYITSINLKGNSNLPYVFREFTQFLNNNTTITHVDISRCNISKIKHIFEVLQSNTTLTSLNLDENPIRKKDNKQVIKILKNNTSLKILGFSNIKHKEDVYKILENESIKDLSLVSNNIGQNSVKFFKTLESNTSLTRLNLSSNQLKESNPTWIGKFLANNISLTDLNLSNNQIISSELGHILDGLNQNPTLKVLNLSSNRICGEGIENLGKFTATNPSLTTLILQNTTITPSSAKSIAHGIKNNTTLTMLDLSYCNMDIKSPTIILESLKTNPSLTGLNFNFLRGFPVKELGKHIVDIYKTCFGRKLKIKLIEPRNFDQKPIQSKIDLLGQFTEDYLNAFPDSSNKAYSNSLNAFAKEHNIKLNGDIFESDSSY